MFRVSKSCLTLDLKDSRLPAVSLKLVCMGKRNPPTKNRLRLGQIYFLEAEGLNRLKIGFSENLENRMRVVRSHSPVPLKLLKVVRASIETEQILMAVFGKYKLHNEWFEYSATLKSFVETLTNEEVFTPDMIFKK